MLQVEPFSSKPLGEYILWGTTILLRSLGNDQVEVNGSHCIDHIDRRWLAQLLPCGVPCCQNPLGGPGGAPCACAHIHLPPLWLACAVGVKLPARSYQPLPGQHWSLEGPCLLFEGANGPSHVWELHHGPHLSSAPVLWQWHASHAPQAPNRLKVP